MLVPALLSVVSCAHPREAFEERIAGPLSGRFERVELACEGDRGAPEPPQRARLQLGPVSGPVDQRARFSPFVFVPESASGEFVGEVFGQGTGTTGFQAPFPLGVEGAPLGMQLASAVTVRLGEVGIRVEHAQEANASAAASPALWLGIEKVWVASSPGRFWELTGHLLAEVAWTATVRDADAREIWQRSVATRVERRILYAYERDHESALREAWCAALDQFQEAAAAELLRRLPAAR